MSCKEFCFAYLSTRKALLSSGVSLQHQSSLGFLAVKETTNTLIRQHNIVYSHDDTSHLFLALSSARSLINCILETSPLGQPLKNKQ